MNDEVRDLRAGEFLLDALEMTLQSRGDPDLRYTGPGQIRQEPDGSVGYVLYDRETTVEFRPDLWPKEGSLIADSTLFDLSVKDWRGRQWRAERVGVDPSAVYGEPGAVIRGRIRRLTGESTGYIKTGARIWVYYPERLEIPSNLVTQSTIDQGGRKSHSYDRNVWQGNTDDFSFRLTKQSDGLEVEVTAPYPLPSGFEDRITETLWFVLARPVKWQMFRRDDIDIEEFTIAPTPRPMVRPRIEPPLRLDHDDAATHLGTMLALYLKYVWNVSSPHLHPTSATHQQLLRASATFIEMEALALGIAVESLIRREFSSLGVPADEWIQSVDSVLDALPALQLPATSIDRLRNQLGNLQGANPREAMNKLVEQGVFTAKQRKSWNAIRHKAAHGMSFDGPIAELLTHCNTTYVGLLRLIFAVIGYKGPYTNYAVEGWPDDIFE